MFFYRQDCRKVANCRYQIYSQAKNQVFRPAEATCCTDSRQTWHGRRAHGSAWLCKISPQSGRGVGTRPQYMKKFLLFGKRVASQGWTLWPISEIFTRFYTPSYPGLVFQIWRDSLHRLRSYCWETVRRSFRPSFSLHAVGKTMRLFEKKMIGTFFSDLDELYQRAKFGEDRYNARRL